MNSPGHRIRNNSYLIRDTYLGELIKLGIANVEDGWITLNIEQLVSHSVIVSDDMYENFKDVGWLRDQRTKLGLNKGTKDEASRARQRARRKKRKIYNLEQRAKRLAQPPQELPLSDIVF